MAIPPKAMLEKKKNSKKIRVCLFIDQKISKRDVLLLYLFIYLFSLLGMISIFGMCEIGDLYVKYKISLTFSNNDC